MHCCVLAVPFTSIFISIISMCKCTMHMSFAEFTENGCKPQFT